MKPSKIFCATMAVVFTIAPFASALAHHGGVSAAFGPGSPVETSSPLTLPKGKFLLYGRYELAEFEKFGDDRDVGGNDKFTFFNTLFGYGINDAVSFYASIPYVNKELIDDNASQGFGDINLILQYGFKYGSRDGFKGWYSFDADDTAGEEYTLPEWKFGLSFSMTLPSGVIDNEDKNGQVLDINSQPGFAGPSYNFTGIVSKMFAPHWTWNADVQFRTFTFNGGSGGGKPGNEFRINNAVMYEAVENPGGFLSRLDLILEANFLDLQKDIDENRIQDDASGGSLLYLSPGVRFTFRDRVSLGVLYKEVAWKSLNNESEQQGGEGLEDYRLITTLSIGF